MKLSFFCLSNAQSYVLSVPDVLDIWNMPCAWRGKNDQHSTCVVPPSALENDAVKSLLTTGRLVLDPAHHAKIFRLDPAEVAAQYAETFDGQFMLPTKTAEAPAGPPAPSVEELAAVEAAALAEAEALAAAEAAAAEAAEPEPETSSKKKKK